MQLTMTLERWRQVERVLQAALELEGAERAAFLQRECGDDSELRKEIETLLTSPENAHRFLAANALEDNTALLEDSALPSVTRRIGPYSIEQQLGSGGMGSVYLAHDARFSRKVALKVLDPFLAGDSHWTSTKHCASRYQVREYHGHARWAGKSIGLWSVRTLSNVINRCKT